MWKLSALFHFVKSLFPASKKACSCAEPKGTTFSSSHDPVRLTISCIRARKWEEALHWVRQWTPSSWCGNCLQSMLAEKYLTEALLLTKLNRLDEVSAALDKVCQLPLAAGHEHLFVTLVKELHQKGQSQQVKEVLKRRRELAELAGMGISPSFVLRVLGLMEEGKVNELVELLSEDYEGPSRDPSWQRHLVSWALSQFGKDAAERILQQWRTMKLPTQKAIYTLLLLPDERCWEQAWQLLLADQDSAFRRTAIYALLHGDEEVRKFVKGKMNSPDEDERGLAQRLVRECQEAVGSPNGWKSLSLWEGLFVEDL